MPNNNSHSKILKRSFFVSVTVLLSKALGFVKQAVIAWAFGSSGSTDVYFFADGYASMFGQIMSESVAPLVSTSYIEQKERKSETKANDVVYKSLVFYGLIGVALVIINSILVNPIASLFGASYSSDQQKELVFFLLCIFPIILMMTVCGVIQGYLNSVNRYIPGKLASLFLSVFIILSVILLHDKLSVNSLLIGYITSYSVYTIFMLVLFSRSIGIKITNPFKDREFIRSTRKFVPLVVGNSVVDFGHFIDKIVATTLTAGSISALTYAQRTSSDLMFAVVVTSIGTVLLTSLAKKVAQSNKDEITIELNNMLEIMTFVVAIFTALYLINGKELVRFLLQRGNFTAEDTQIVFRVGAFYSCGFIFMLWREFLIKAHYAFQDTLTPMINSIIGVVVNLFGSILLSRIMGVAGISLATSISLLVVSIISIITLKKHLGKCIITFGSVKNYVKILLVFSLAIISGMIFNDHILITNYFIKMCISSLLMSIVYFVSSALLRVHGSNELVAFIRRKICH